MTKKNTFDFNPNKNSLNFKVSCDIQNSSIWVKKLEGDNLESDLEINLELSTIEKQLSQIGQITH